jgi:hypothetical protein
MAPWTRDRIAQLAADAGVDALRVEEDPEHHLVVVRLAGTPHEAQLLHTLLEECRPLGFIVHVVPETLLNLQLAHSAENPTIHVSRNPAERTHAWDPSYVPGEAYDGSVQVCATCGLMRQRWGLGWSYAERGGGAWGSVDIRPCFRRASPYR